MPPSPPALSPSQRHIVQQIIARAPTGLGSHVKRVLEKSALETGQVESNFSNPKGGTGTSQGWRQETSSSYPGLDRRNLSQSIDRYYQEAAKAYRPGIKSGDLAAAVQRPAAPYRGRYAAVSGQAEALLGGNPPQTTGGPQAASTSVTAPSQVSTFDQTGFDQARKRQLVASFLQSQGSTSKNPLFTSGLLSTKPVDQSQFTGTKTVPGKTVSTNVSTKDVTGTLATLVERANKITSSAKPYKWGGGHQRAGGALAQPFDCSGAVSRVLGINPKVASQFQQWGQPGKGKNVSIYAKPDHVIMAVNGHFFGTSASNPGGGAGWIPMSALPKSYLSQFTVRHPSGL